MTSVKSAAPTLARLSFRMPPERRIEFEVAYEEPVVPLLKQHGLVVSSECERQTVEGVFSQPFAVATPAEAIAKTQASVSVLILMGGQPGKSVL